MDIALIADDTKKELMTQFCIAYCGILSKHNICATSVTGKYVQEATGLEIEKLLSGSHGGEQQIASRISYNEIDVLLFFRSTTPNHVLDENESNLLRMCDVHNVPVATNIATAEVLICALDHGDLDWREIVNPKSDYNRRRRGITY
ncbi:MAG: methylglyoxal synthase [Oscillospiraceae bacterium]|nr:methylglyoxal synthase [Oscillospiraceae bacterium]